MYHAFNIMIVCTDYLDVAETRHWALYVDVDVASSQLHCILTARLSITMHTKQHVKPSDVTGVYSSL